MLRLMYFGLSEIHRTTLSIAVARRVCNSLDSLQVSPGEQTRLHCARASESPLLTTLEAIRLGTLCIWSQGDLLFAHQSRYIHAETRGFLCCLAQRPIIMKRDEGLKV